MAKEITESKKELKIKETAATYTITPPKLSIPISWTWLNAFKPEEQIAFFQEIVDTLAKVQESKNWNELMERIAKWQNRATPASNEDNDLTILKRQLVEEGGNADIANLLGKYRGQLSPVETFIHNKHLEKSLEG